MDDEFEDNDDDLPNELDTELRVIRLVTGEDLITECTDIDESGDGFDAVLLINPLKILYFVNAQSGTITINFMRWVNTMLVDDQIFRIDRSQVLTYQYPTKKLADKYMEWVEEDQERLDKRKTKVDGEDKKLAQKRNVEKTLRTLDSLEKKLKDVKSSKFVDNALNRITKKVNRKVKRTRKPKSPPPPSESGPEEA